CTTSNHLGQYLCTVPEGWSGTVTPSASGYSFGPSSRNFTSVASHQTNQSFAATLDTAAAPIYFVHVDHLNTPREIYDASAQLRWKWDQQEAFGVNVPDENPSSLGAFEFALRFPGQYADKETNLAYNYHRNYDASVGRYVESDPIGLESGSNTYVYVGANPLAWIDPSGLAPLYCQYSQSTGMFFCIDLSSDKTVIQGRCYSGTGPGRDNPLFNDIRDVGPIPRGWWGIGSSRPMPSGGKRQPTIPFAPDPQSNSVWGTNRDPGSFWMHGNN